MQVSYNPLNLFVVGWAWHLFLAHPHLFGTMRIFAVLQYYLLAWKYAVVIIDFTIFTIIFADSTLKCVDKTIIGATFSYISFFRTTLLVHGFFLLLASSKLYKFSFGDSPFRSEFLPVSSKILGMLCNFFLTASSFIVSWLFSTKKERFFLSHAASYNTVMVVISSKTFLAANQPNYYHLLLFYSFGLLLFAVLYQSDSFFFCIFTIWWLMW